MTTQTVTPTDEEPLAPAPAPEEEALAEEVAPEAAPPEGEEAGTHEEEADPRAQVKDALQTLLAEDPDLAKELGIKAPEEEQLPPDEALHQREYGLNQRERQAALQGYQGALQAYQPKRAAGAILAKLQGLETQARNSLRQATQAKDAGGYPVELDADRVPLGDPNKVAADVEYYVTEAQKAAFAYAYTHSRNEILDILEASPEHRSLNADERGARDWLLSGKATDEQGQPLSPASIGGLLALVYLEAARRNAPETVTKKAKADAEKEAKVLEARMLLVQIAKGSANGAKLAGGGKGPRSREQEDKMLLDPETPISTIKEIMARRASS